MYTDASNLVLNVASVAFRARIITNVTYSYYITE